MIDPEKDGTETGNEELEKSKGHVIVQIIDYRPKSIVNRTILKKITGNVTVSCLDAGEEIEEKSSPFDTYVQIIDGAAEILIDKKSYKLALGEGIVIPAHAYHNFNAIEQFKMLSTVIKSGYEDL